MNVYIGVDPGPSSGIVVLVFDKDEVQWHVFQCSANTLAYQLGFLCQKFRPRIIAYELFVPSNRAGNKGKDADTTRSLAHVCKTVAVVWDMPEVGRKAADIKPWATDKRLEKLGFPMGAKFKDARDAGRHALYAAVRDGKERDPLA